MFGLDCRLNAALLSPDPLPGVIIEPLEYLETAGRITGRRCQIYPVSRDGPFPVYDPVTLADHSSRKNSIAPRRAQISAKQTHTVQPDRLMDSVVDTVE